MELSELVNEFILALNGAILSIWEEEEKHINNDTTFKTKLLFKKKSLCDKIIINSITTENYNFLLGNVN